MNRTQIPLFHRWALVARDAHDRTTILSSHFTYRAARRAKLNDEHDRRSTWSVFPPPVVEPTDWAPQIRRRMRVLQVLADHGPIAATALSAHTAMSPRAVERVLLDLGRSGWAVCASRQLVGEGAQRTVEGAWRLKSPEEWTGGPAL